MSDGGGVSIDPSHYGPGGPVDVVHRFLKAVFEGTTYDEWWELLDDNLKLCGAQDWLWNNREHPDVVGMLEDSGLDGLAARLVAKHPAWLWREFARIQDDTMQDRWAALYERDLGAASRPRPLGPDLELVILLPTDGKGPLVFTEDTLVADDVLGFVVRRVGDDWLIAATGDFVQEPGWPPKHQPGP